MQKAYRRIDWKNDVTPLNEDNLNLMDSALNELDNRIISIDTAKLGKTEASSMLTNFALNTETGVITLTYYDGSKQTINTNLAKIALNISYDATNERLVLTMPDGSVTYVDMSALITQYEFVESDVAYFTVTSDGKVKVEIKDHSITADKLQPNFLADVQTASNSASKSASSALNSANSASVSEVNAKKSEEKAKMYAENASAVTGVQIATKDIAGLIKGGDNHIAEDGTLTLTARTDSGVLEYSHEGGIRLHSISAVEDRQRTTTGAQLFDKDAVSKGYELNTDGSVSVNSYYYVSDYIEVVEGENYYLDKGEGANGISNCFYDATKNFVSVVSKNNGVLTIPSGAKYVRFNGTYEQLDKVMFSLGDTARPYEPYTGGKPSPAPGELAIISNNQLKVKLSEETEDGITYSDNGNGGVEVIGDATADVRIVVGEVALKAGTYYAYNNYTDKGEVSADGSYTVYIYESDNLIDAIAFLDSVGETAFTLTEDKTVDYLIEIISGNYINSTFKPMIATTSGATWDVYEEGYTEGYPQPIEATTMKNLLDCRGFSPVTETTGGGKIIPVYDEYNRLQYINVDGTFAVQTDYYLVGSIYGNAAIKDLTSGEKYILSGKANTSIRWRLANSEGSINDNSGSESYNFTYNGEMYILLRIAANSTFTNEKIYPMIRSASILDDTYVPYGCMRVVGKGKNLVESCKTSTTSTSYGLLISNVRASLKKDVEYTISVEITATAKAQLYWNNSSGVFSNKYFYVSAGTNRYSYTFTAKKDYEYADNVSWLSKNNTETGVEVTAKNVQIEENTEATDYVAYQAPQSTILSKPFADFHSINGVSDTLTPYNEVRRFATVVFDGSDDEGWGVATTSDGSKMRLISTAIVNVVKTSDDNNAIANALCTQYECVGNQDTYDCIEGFAITSTGKLAVYSENFSTASLDEWKAYLAEHPMTVVYELATEQTTALLTADQIALHTLKSFDGVTHLVTDTYPPMVIDCEYGTSKVGAEMYEALNKADANEIRYNELASALLALSQE